MYLPIIDNLHSNLAQILSCNWKSFPECKIASQVDDIPLLRHLPHPLDPAVLHLAVRPDAFCDGLGDDGLFQFLVFLNRGAGLLNEGVNRGALFVKERGDTGLLGKFWQKYCYIRHLIVHYFITIYIRTLMIYSSKCHYIFKEIQIILIIRLQC